MEGGNVVVVVGSAHADNKKAAKVKAARDALDKLKLKGLKHSRQSVIDYVKALNSKNESSAQSWTVDSISAKEEEGLVAASQKTNNADSSPETGSQNSCLNDISMCHAENKAKNIQSACKYDKTLSSWLTILPALRSSEYSDNDTKYVRDFSSCKVSMPNAEEQVMPRDTSASRNLYEPKNDEAKLTLEDVWTMKPDASIEQATAFVNLRGLKKLNLQVDEDASLKLHKLGGKTVSSHLGETCDTSGYSRTIKPASSINPERKEENPAAYRQIDSPTVSSSPTSPCYNATDTTKGMSSSSPPKTAYGIGCAERANTGEIFMSSLLCNQNGGNTRMTSAGNGCIRANRIYGMPPLYSNSLVKSLSSIISFSEENSKEKDMYSLDLLNSVGHHVSPTSQVEFPLCDGNRMIEVTKQTSQSPSQDEKCRAFSEKQDRFPENVPDFAKDKLIQVQEDGGKIFQPKLISPSSSLFSSCEPGLNSEYCFTTAGPVTKTSCSQGQPRSELYEICSKNKWSHPIFTCLTEEGLSHNKLFTYNAKLTLPGIGSIKGEGEPTKTKKLAMDTAAFNLLLQLRELQNI